MSATPLQKQHLYRTARLKVDYLGLPAGAYVGVRFVLACHPGCDLYAIYRGCASDGIGYLGLAVDGEQIENLCL